MKEADVYSELCNEELMIRISGEIDHHSAGKIREIIDRDVFFYRAPRVILDLSAIDFMDSSGLGLILGRYTKIKDMGSVLIIKDPTQVIMKILKLSGVDRFIKIQGVKPVGSVLKVKGISGRERRNEENEKNGTE